MISEVAVIFPDVSQLPLFLQEQCAAKFFPDMGF